MARETITARAHDELLVCVGLVRTRRAAEGTAQQLHQMN